ncbi:hypothetical protein COLU111180_12200 [Cohnella lubricantis]|uniref:Uncharacterized protein n=1 Tax=Cohnella lubricantis TaxID=2163172 RepID=A0A841T748_9BACL|nr:hypothetical protein [Cohnella lubricantis]MBB6675939.1 hypothetical protein [Cohnella lubricantis]MBP2117945.1 septum formation topological specificity factor MinE [Cohnella lubricantis]
MSRKAGNALAHTMASGDAVMEKKKEKAFRLRFILVEDRGADIARNLARREIEKVLAKYGAVSDNLDEILSKHITGEMRNEQKEG